MTRGAWLVILGGIGLLPVWRSGLREKLSVYEFILEHTIWGHEVTYIPEELLTAGESQGIYLEVR